MAATKEDINRWLDDLYEGDASHMIVVCDTFDWDRDYPVYVPMGEDPHKVYDRYNGRNMNKVMEVYSRWVDREAQLYELRSMHFEESNVPKDTDPWDDISARLTALEKAVFGSGDPIPPHCQNSESFVKRTMYQP